MKALRRFATVLLLPMLAVSCTDLTTSPKQIQAPKDGVRQSSGAFWINCSASLTVGQTGWCSAYSYSGGFVYPSYWSSNPGVASVAGGTIFANNPGSAVIYASAGGYMSSSHVTVYPPPAPAVVTQVTVTSATVYLGASAQLTARAYDQYGKQMSGKTATWTIDNPAIATISSTGVVTAQSLGSTTARATIDGVTGTGTVWVEEYQDPGNPMCGDYYC